MVLIDNGADISLLKGNKLTGTNEYDPEKKVGVKCVDESPVGQQMQKLNSSTVQFSMNFS